MNGIIPFLYYERNVRTRRYNEYLRDTSDPFNISDQCFIENYRMPKCLVIKLIEEIKPYVGETGSLTRIPVHFEVLAALNFYASGKHQRRLGMDAFATMSQSKVSSSITKISEVIGTKLGDKYVIFPKTVIAAKVKKDEFYNRYGVPGIVGAIDCTHIAVANRLKKDEFAYMNRKKFHSINTQVICDYQMRIMSLDARYPGATPDFFIWQRSKALPVMEKLSSEDNTTWLFADNGYALQPFVMVPYRKPKTDAQQKYNKIHSKIRSNIDRCIIILKSRFRCLKRKSGDLKYTQEKIAQIIYSCATLHNILIDNKFPVCDIEDESEENVPTRIVQQEEKFGKQNREYLTNLIYESNFNK